MSLEVSVDEPADRLLVVCDPNGVSHALSERYPACEVVSVDSYLAGIAAAADPDRRIRAVIAGVDPNCRRLPSVVTSLREVCGHETRLVLCCVPACEPMARRAVDAGANDYLIHPPTGEELDAALGIPATVTAAPSPSTGAMIAPEELDAVGLMLSQVDDATGALLDTLARHLRQGLRAGGVRVTADRTTGQAGTTQGTPPLIEPLQRDAAAIGQVELWPTQAASFTPADAEKLRHYARLTERILDLAARQRQWRRLAMTDDLTGLPNRRYLYARLDELLARAAEQRRRVTFMLFDIDNFKGYNDRYGHPVGDQIIRETGQLFRQCCRKHDVVTRMGGDEFGVVFWDADEPRVAGSKHPESPLDVLHRFKAALGQHQFPALGADAQGTLTVSAGLAGYPWDARTRDELIERADQALLEAKRQGKNRIHLVGE